MKKLIAVAALSVAVLFGVKAFATVVSNVNINGSDFANDVASNVTGNTLTFNGTIPVASGSTVRSVNINFQANQMTVTTNAA